MRLNFDIRFEGVASVSFDTEEFRGLNESQIKTALRRELPSTPNDDDLNSAASAIRNAVT